MKTNYDLCGFINDFIDRTVVDGKERRQYKTKYFGLYIFLLYKMFNFKREYCKDLISIFCNSFVSYALSKLAPSQVFQDVAYVIMRYDEVFDACLKGRKGEDNDTLLREAMDAVTEAVVELTGDADLAKEKRIRKDILLFIQKFAIELRNGTKAGKSAPAGETDVEA